MILSCHDSVSHLRLHKESSQLANNLDYCITIAVPRHTPAPANAHAVAHSETNRSLSPAELQDYSSGRRLKCAGVMNFRLRRDELPGLRGRASGTVDSVRANVHAPNGVSFQIENGAQVALDADRIDGDTKFSRQPVNLMRSQSGVEGILFEDSKSFSGGGFLTAIEAAQSSAK